MSRRTFCDANDEIRSLLNDVISEVELSIKYEDISGLHTALDDLKNIADIVEETQDYVDSMEDRLKKYREAIENLGFSRDSWLKV